MQTPKNKERFARHQTSNRVGEEISMKNVKFIKFAPKNFQFLEILLMVDRKIKIAYPQLANYDKEKFTCTLYGKKIFEFFVYTSFHICCAQKNNSRQQNEANNSRNAKWNIFFYKLCLYCCMRPFPPQCKY